jgi:hypothetical protein
MSYFGQPIDRDDQGHLRVQLTPGTPKTGLWCPTCLLPSRSEVPIYVLGENGPSVIATANHCDGCR